MILQQSGINHIFFPALCYSQARDSLQPVIESSEKFFLMCTELHVALIFNKHDCLVCVAAFISMPCIKKKLLS